MNKKHDHFNDCLARIRRGEELERCLADYPEEVEELCILLSSVGVIKEYAKIIKPRPDYIFKTQENLLDEYNNRYLSWKAKIMNVLKPARHLAVVTTIAFLIFVSTFVLGLTLSVLASENTMPGQTLYTVKLAAEQIRLFFTFSDDDKIDYLTQLAEARVKEIAYTIGQRDTNKIEDTLKKLENNLSELERIITPNITNSVIAASDREAQELERIESTVRNSYIIVQDKLSEITEPDLEGRERIINRINQAYFKVIVTIESAKSAVSEN